MLKSTPTPSTRSESSTLRAESAQPAPLRRLHIQSPLAFFTVAELPLVGQHPFGTLHPWQYSPMTGDCAVYLPGNFVMISCTAPGPRSLLATTSRLIASSPWV